MFYAYIEASPLTVTSAYELIEYFGGFTSWYTAYIIPPDENTNTLSTVQFIIIFKQKVWYFINYYVREVKAGEISAVGQGAQAALACLTLNVSVEDALKATCATDIYCSEPIQIFEIPIL